MVNKIEILNTLNIFHQSTGIGAMFFDSQLHISAAVPGKNMLKDYLCLGMDQINDFLKSHFFRNTGCDHKFHTYFLDSNLVCNISFLFKDSGCCGAFVTQPVFFKPPASEDIERLLTQYDFTVKERSILRTALLKVPVISYERIMPTGMVLHSLSRIMEDRESQQVLQGPDYVSRMREKSTLSNQTSSPLTNRKRNHDFDYATYVKLKEYIESGDPVGLSTFMGGISAGRVQFEKLIENDFMKSLKISFIKSCAMGSLIAINSGVHYDKALDISDDAIRIMEKLDNINEIYDLMRDTLISYSQAVSSSRTLPSSKHVRQILEYISVHYREKITLADLSQLTNLSMFYLSNLIKKETGLSLAENVNRARIEESKKLLSGSNISILEVAQLVGYNYQNHFAAIFKKYMGFSPSEYRNVLGLDKVAGHTKELPESPLPQLLEQLHNRLSALNGYYDYARIVDISTKKSWRCSSQDNTVPIPKLCHEFWKKNEPCENCISIMACIQNTPMFKIVDQGDEVFLVVAIPKILNGTRYGIEIIKRVTGCFLSVIDTDYQELLPSKEDNHFGKLEGLSDLKKEINRKINYSQINKVPLTLVAAHVSISTSLTFENTDIEKQIWNAYKEAIQRSLRSSEDYMESYLGDTFIIILSKADIMTANKIMNRINEKFYEQVTALNIHADRISTHHGMKLITEQTKDPETLLKLTFLNLYESIPANQ